MANTFLTPDIIAREALMVLRANAVMPMLVHRDYSSEFVAKVGDTITVRKPATFTANEFTTAISVQDAAESSVTVKMDKLLDVSFAVTSKERALDIKDFSAQLVVPAMQAFLEKIDGYLLALQSGITNRVTATGGAVADTVSLRAMLQSGKAPLTDRHLVLNTATEATFLKDPNFVSAEKVGDNGTTLRNASLGNKFGFNVYADQNADAVAAMNALAFHKNAFALVTRQLEPPQGAAQSAIVSYDGFSLRVVYGYDIDKKTDVVSIDMLCGVAELDENLAAVLVPAAPAGG